MRFSKKGSPYSIIAEVFNKNCAGLTHQGLLVFLRLNYEMGGHGNRQFYRR